MSSFKASVIDSQPLSQNLLATVRQIGEHKGKQKLYAEQAPQVLETLRRAALIQSTDASNRIEGVTAEFSRVQALVERSVKPANRSEQEIAGYRDVLETIHINHEGMEFAPGLLLQLHRDLYQFVPSEGGVWKPTDNLITEIGPDGAEVVRFTPVPAFKTPEVMDELHREFDRYRQAGSIDPLLLIPAYVLDFLCVHPFQDGNGRMARLLSLLLLYQAGYEVGRYVSLEGIIEETDESYYETLLESSQGWHEDEHSLLPWWNYFLGVVLAAYRRFEDRVGAVTKKKGAKGQMVVDAIRRLPQQFQIADVRRASIGVSRPTINRTLGRLREEGRIRVVKMGRNATWEKIHGKW